MLAIEAAGLLGDRSLLPLLLELSRNGKDQDPYVRGVVHEAIASLSS